LKPPNQPEDTGAASGGWSLLPDLGLTPRMAAVLQAAWFCFAVGICLIRKVHAGVYATVWLVGALVLIYLLQRLGGRPAAPIGRSNVAIGADTPKVDRLLHDLMSIALFLFCMLALAVPPKWIRLALH
jgi:hypothetical protein